MTQQAQLTQLVQGSGNESLNEKEIKVYEVNKSYVSPNQEEFLKIYSKYSFYGKGFEKATRQPRTVID